MNGLGRAARRRCGAALVGALLFGFSKSVPAEQPSAADTERAKDLYTAGAAAYAAGNFEAAVQALGQAYALSPRATVLFSLAQAERQLYTLEHRVSTLRDAIAHYRAYVQETPQGGRRTDAVEVLGELESEASHLPREAQPEAARKAPTRLMVSTQIKDAVISIDGVAFDENPVIEEAAPGPHVVVTRAPGYFGDTRTVTTIEGSLVATEVALREQPARVTLDVPAGSEVVLDGKFLGLAPTGPLEVAAGAHLIAFSQAGHIPQVRPFRVDRGAVVDLAATLRLTAQRKISYGVLGAGALALGTGGAAALVALVAEGDAKRVGEAMTTGNVSQSQLDAYNGAIDRRNTWRDAAGVVLAAGAVLVVGGAFLYSFDHREGIAPSEQVGGQGKVVGLTSGGLGLSF